MDQLHVDRSKVSSPAPILDSRNAARTDAAIGTDADQTSVMHQHKAHVAQEKAERDRELLRDKDVPFTERAKAAGDLALRRAESAYHDTSAALRHPH